MDNRNDDWYGPREDRRRNEGRRFSDRGTEPPRPYRHNDLRATYSHPRGRYAADKTRPYQGGPLGSELRDPYERDHLYAPERPRRETEMTYYSPYGEPTSSSRFAGRGPKRYQRSDDRDIHNQLRVSGDGREER
jgi:hypothetical protein